MENVKIIVNLYWNLIRYIEDFERVDELEIFLKFFVCIYFYEDEKFFFILFCLLFVNSWFGSCFFLDFVGVIEVWIVNFKLFSLT